jgi:putative solute:sodium symporter small subunit
MTHEQQVAYWKTNLRYIIGILAVWFAVSYLFGIIFSEPLDAAGSIGGFPIGFWFANQGSEVIFVVLIFIYVGLMNGLDKKFGVYED